MNASFEMPALNPVWNPIEVQPATEIAKADGETRAGETDILVEPVVNGRLGALLLINKQLQPDPMLPEVKSRANRPDKSATTWNGPCSAQGAGVAKRGRKIANRRRKPWSYGLRIAIAFLMIAGGCGMSHLINGFQRIDHRRERIQWARQLQAQEQENQRLKREQRVLTGMLAMRVASEEQSPNLRVDDKLIHVMPHRVKALPGL